MHSGVTKFNLGYAVAEVEGLGKVAAKVAKEKDIVIIKNTKKMECKERRKKKR